MAAVVQALIKGAMKSLTSNDACPECGSVLHYHGPVITLWGSVVDSFFECPNETCREGNDAYLKQMAQSMKESVIRSFREKSRESLANNIHQVLYQMEVPLKYHDVSFETFIGGEKYVESLRRYAESFNGSVYLYGNCGSGKTHLAVSLLREFHVFRECDSQTGLFVTVPELLLDIRDSFRDRSSKSEKDIIDKYMHVDFLVLDDFCAEKTSDFSLATLYIILNGRLNKMLPTVITSNIVISGVEKFYDERIGSRLAEYSYFNVKMPDYRKSNHSANIITGGN